MEVLILIPKETYNTCNFPGEVVWTSSPDTHLSMDSFQKSRESVEMKDAPQIYGCSIKAAI